LKIPTECNLDRYQWESEIDRWIFSEEHRAMLKRNLLDGRTYEQIAEEFNCSRDKIARLIPKLQNTLFKKIK
jgi:DNA-directed RNA polymerase specialized sigma24 family protein